MTGQQGWRLGASWLAALASTLVFCGALADTGDATTATLTIVGLPEDGGGPAGGAGETECEPFCAPPLPALYATQRADLVADVDADGQVDPGDTVRYTALITNFAPVAMDGVRYFALVDPHLALAEDSLHTSLGTIQGHHSPDGRLTAVSAAVGTLLPDEVVLLTFDVQVREVVPGGVPALVGQGLVYASTTFPVLTDNPETALLQDATFSPLGEVPAGSMAALPAGGPASETALVKLARLDPQPAVLRVLEQDARAEFAISYANHNQRPVEGLTLADVVGPYLSVQTDSIMPADAQVWQVAGLQVVTARFDELPSGEEATMSYRTTIGHTAPPEVAYLATRALASAPGLATQLSDDPATDLLADPTAVLLPFRCAGGDGWTWEEWRQVVSSAPTGLMPLVLAEKDSSQHLRWVLFGGDFFGDLSPHPSLRPPYWPGWALAGLVEVPFATLSPRDLGFRLAERDEPYVEGFLANEPLFMWAIYDQPLFARVPATDKGELLWIERFNRPYCDRGYLPLLAELDWSRDWDMRWLEDELIVATVAEEPGKP
ncbi:MAG: hypothetical protein ACP5G2_06465 [Candidatus Bipolaricaulaceae bacterium]